MEYKRLEINDLIVCEPKLHTDNRGFVFESFKQSSFNEFLGFEVKFCQDNISHSKYGVVRGIHTNISNYAQSKLVSVLKGKIQDVAVDFRKGSPTFGKYISIELSSENKKQLFVPKGFLHGFSVLSEEALVMMKVDRYFAGGKSIGVAYNDDILNIDWKLRKKDIIVSSVDNDLPSFKDVRSDYNYGIDYYK